MSRKKIPKWGFGMAPLKPATEERYCDAIHQMRSFLDSANQKSLSINLNAISEVKGLVNRCVRQDQWDWHTVYQRFGEPNPIILKKLGPLLAGLRTAIKSDEISEAQRLRKKLLDERLLTICLYFLGEEQVPTGGGGYIYILSTRDKPSVLKIRMTERSVAQRVNEINRATGVYIPFSVRRVFKVKDAKKAESELFELFKEQRIRPDREFFEIDYFEANRTIEKYLADEQHVRRLEGEIIWFSNEKGYGFIKGTDGTGVFVHATEIVHHDLSIVKTGIDVEYDLGHSPKGRCALSVILRGVDDSATT